VQSVSTVRYPVQFVGAGPGDPDLITVKGQKSLMAADTVIYAGSLVPQALLKWTRPETLSIDSAPLNLDQIVDIITTHWDAGKRVVRLHTGDPSLYGAIFEQMAALDARNIPFAVIPGVTAAFAAAASMGLEYTLPEISQTLILTRMAGRTPVPELENLDALAARLQKKSYWSYVIMGEGCLDEGQTWEGFMAAAKFKPERLVALIDYNGFQLDGSSDEIMPLAPLFEKFNAFQWNVAPTLFNGHQVKDVQRALDWANQQTEWPAAIISISEWRSTASSSILASGGTPTGLPIMSR